MRPRKKLEASDSLHKAVGIHPVGRTLFHCSFLALQFRLSKLVASIESRDQKSINNLGSQGSPLNNELTMDGTQVSFTRGVPSMTFSQAARQYYRQARDVLELKKLCECFFYMNTCI